MSGRPSIYWDTCIFISWLTNQKRQNPNDMLGVEKLGTLFDSGQISVVTSTVAIAEVLESRITAEQYHRFRLLFSRRNFDLVDVSREIAEIAQEIRNFYFVPNESSLEVPDCLHLATSISFQCNAFYTFDGESKRKNTILMLKNPIANKYNMQILIPEPEKVLQLSVLDFKASEIDEENQV